MFANAEIEHSLLLISLFEAYYEARRNKRNTLNQLRFELEYEASLLTLADELLEGKYSIGRSICFIIDKPVKREILAADFRDRVVHHLLYDRFSPIFEKFFINDAYSCRKGRGTLFGICRMAQFMKHCSENYTASCYVMKLDISGYFMHIDRTLLWNKIVSILQKSTESVSSFHSNLLKQVVFHNPIENCIFRSKPDAWKGLPNDKSMFRAAPGCGLPIGNLTSQLLSNVYLNSLDHFVTETLGIKYYGRYVDDFVLMDAKKENLLYCRDRIETFLSENDHLTLHPKKFYLQHYAKGFAFLGAYIKPGRIYIGKRIKNNFLQALKKEDARLLKPDAPEIPANPKQVIQFRASLNSYLGLLKHFNTFNLKKKALLGKKHNFFRYGYLNTHLNKFVIHKNNKPANQKPKHD